MNTTQEKPRKRVNLAQRYEEEIRSWNWPAIAEECSNNLFIEDNCLRGSSYLGSVFSLYPSGKYYMPWCSNQTSFDEIKDQLFGELLETIAEEHGLYISGGEGDPCDGTFLERLRSGHGCVFAFANLGEEFYSIDGQGDETIAFDAWGDEVFRADSEKFDKGLRAFMEENGFFPDLVSISDHGNVHRYELEE